LIPPTLKQQASRLIALWRISDQRPRNHVDDLLATAAIHILFAVLGQSCAERAFWSLDDNKVFSSDDLRSLREIFVTTAAELRALDNEGTVE